MAWLSYKRIKNGFNKVVCIHTCVFSSIFLQKLHWFSLSCTIKWPWSPFFTCVYNDQIYWVTFDLSNKVPVNDTRVTFLSDVKRKEWHHCSNLRLILTWWMRETPSGSVWLAMSAPWKRILRCAMISFRSDRKMTKSGRQTQNIPTHPITRDEFRVSSALERRLTYDDVLRASIVRLTAISRARTDASCSVRVTFEGGSTFGQLYSGAFVVDVGMIVTKSVAILDEAIEDVVTTGLYEASVWMLRQLVTVCTIVTTGSDVILHGQEAVSMTTAEGLEGGGEENISEKELSRE